MNTITLPAGSLKLLLINAAETERNKQRGPTKLAPVGRIVVVEDGWVKEIHESNSIEVNGPVSLTYTPHAHLVPNSPRDDLRVAFTTTAEVVIGSVASPERAEQSPATPKAPTAAKPQKPARVNNVKTEENQQ